MRIAPKEIVNIFVYTVNKLIENNRAMAGARKTRRCLPGFRAPVRREFPRKSFCV